MVPFKQSIKDDKKEYTQLRFDYNTLIERVHELESYAMIQNWKLKPTKQWEHLVASPKKEEPKSAATPGLKRSNLKGKGAVKKDAQVQISESIAEESSTTKSKATTVVKEPRKTVKDLGVPAAKAKVPEPTPLHEGLLKTSKRTQKREAGLLNDPNIKYQGSSDDSHSLSDSEEEEKVLIISNLIYKGL